MAERSAGRRSLVAANGPRAEGGDAPAVTARLAVPGAVQMRLLGSRLARLLRAGDLVVLAGPLGAGKTTLVQGLGEGLAVRGPVTSPTFVIARVHPSQRGGPDLVHADAYRLGSRLEVDDLDLDADLDHAVTVVEWGEGLVEDLAAGHLLVTIDWPAPAPAPAGGAAGDQVRIVTVSGYGNRWDDAAGQLRSVLAEPLR
jgi:tRNA threonylcarbamoyladenosine biosynthesis protein TsaE